MRIISSWFVVVLLAVVAVSIGGCAGARITVDDLAAARAAGMISVDVAVRTQTVNVIELSLLRPVMIDVEAVLDAEPETRPELWTGLVLGRLETLSTMTELERALCRDAVLVLSSLKVEVDDAEYDAGRERAAAIAAAYLRGVIAGIDCLVPPPRAVTAGPADGAG